MPTVQPLKRTMIEQYLQEGGIEYEVDREGGMALELKDDLPEDCPIQVWLITEGEDSEIYKVFGIVEVPIPEISWESAMALCNAWNGEAAWPKAYLVATESASGVAYIHLERAIDLSEGVHQELFSSFTTQTIGGVLEFAEWATERQFFASNDEEPEE